MSGEIAGGWGFVWAAYGLTLLVFAAYTVSLLARDRRARSSAARTGEENR